MKILATVDFGKRQINQLWEFQEADPSPFLRLIPLEDGKCLVIGLEKHLVTDITGTAVAQKSYQGTLHVLDAITIPR
jgi:uncharacterized membrane protein